jgi:hypothetical protein
MLIWKDHWWAWTAPKVICLTSFLLVQLLAKVDDAIGVDEIVCEIQGVYIMIKYPVCFPFILVEALAQLFDAFVLDSCKIK